MPRTCSIVKCNSKYSLFTQRKLFALPKDPQRRQKWFDAISPYLREERKPRKNYYVCDLHFKEDEVIRNSSIVLKDGTKETVPVLFVTLEPSSVPCFFNEKKKVLSNIGLSASSDHKKSSERDIHMDSENNKKMVITFEEDEEIEQVHAAGRNIRLVPEKGKEYNLSMLQIELKSLWMSEKIHLWGRATIQSCLILSFYGDNPGYATKTILVKEDMSMEIRADGVPYMEDFKQKIQCLPDIVSVMAEVEKKYWCVGSNNETRCKKKLNNLKRVSENIKLSIENLKRKNDCLLKSISYKRKDIEELQALCASASENSIEKAIQNFPSAQQEAVRACMTAAKCKALTGIRYTQFWVLECILLRIKSHRAYQHLLDHQKLQVPTIDTLSKYLKKMKSSYGFNNETFDLLRAKAARMKPEERRGTLVLDEMKLSEAISYNRDTLLFKRFTDLSKYTPKNQKKERGDHALVFLYQPFRGKWVQTVGAFLSKGCANSTILHHLILECIILLENAGFSVDVVTTDGASWNRTMWKHFGLRNLDSSCDHPCRYVKNENDDAGGYSQKLDQLYFCSDFSHLIKLFRNFIMARDETWTPDGVVKKAHFKAVIDCDRGSKSFAMISAHKLTSDHLNPKYYQKINVAMAFQIFSTNVSVAMNLYKSHHKDLFDCDSTIKFIERINSVINAMTSRSPEQALSYDNDRYKIITDFRIYLEEWSYKASEEGYHFMSASTYLVFQVTLKTTIAVMNFLTE